MRIVLPKQPMFQAFEAIYVEGKRRTRFSPTIQRLLHLH